MASPMSYDVNGNADSRNQTFRLFVPQGIPIDQTRNYLSLTAGFYDNLADHGMLGINPRSFKPLASINSKPE